MKKRIDQTTDSCPHSKLALGGPDKTKKTQLVCFGRDILGVKNLFLNIKAKSHFDGKIAQTVT